MRPDARFWAWGVDDHGEIGMFPHLPLAALSADYDRWVDAYRRALATAMLTPSRDQARQGLCQPPSGAGETGCSPSALPIVQTGDL